MKLRAYQNTFKYINNFLAFLNIGLTRARRVVYVDIIYSDVAMCIVIGVGRRMRVGIIGIGGPFNLNLSKELTCISIFTSHPYIAQFDS